jgi:hypothetical protein
MMMYDLEKASKSAPGISLYVSDDPKGSNEVLGPDAPSFPDQDGALVYELWPIGLGRYARHALGIISGETYREPL